MRAWIVLDLGFGDAGKGLWTDLLVRQTGARVVVRHSGGAQAGHNVVTADGRHHTFAQLGAGSFVPGTRTWLASAVVVHPGALLAEAAVFAGKVGETPEGVLGRVGIARGARIITPWHQALNRLREAARGAARHGSCGVGVGERVRDTQGPVAADLGGPAGTSTVRNLAHAARERLRPEAEALYAQVAPGELDREWALFTREDVADRWAAQVAPVAACVREDDALDGWVEGADDVVFEGAQGVLLDEDVGFHPYTTWSRCTDASARPILARWPGVEVRTFGVARVWGVRHGPGPFPTEIPGFVSGDEHNVANPWQGPVRYGHLDGVLLRYAIDAVGGLDHLVVTHLDRVTARPWTPAYAWRTGQGPLDRLSLPRSLAEQEALTTLASTAQPVLTPAVSDEAEVLARVHQLAGRLVDGWSRGPRARDAWLPPEAISASSRR